MKLWLLSVPVLLGLGWFAFGSGSSSAPTAPTPRAGGGAQGLLVRVEGVDEARGHVAVALFDTEDAFVADRKLRTARLDPNTPSWRVDGLEPGRYAIKVFHDRDGDGELDKGAFGIPSEPYGFSNDARGRLGPPNFEDAAFAYEGRPIAVTIRVR